MPLPHVCYHLKLEFSPAQAPGSMSFPIQVCCFYGSHLFCLFKNPQLRTTAFYCFFRCKNLKEKNCTFFLHFNLISSRKLEYFNEIPSPSLIPAASSEKKSGDSSTDGHKQKFLLTPFLLRLYCWYFLLLEHLLRKSSHTLHSPSLGTIAPLRHMLL